MPSFYFETWQLKAHMHEGKLEKTKQAPAATPFSWDCFGDITVTDFQPFLQLYTFLHSRRYPKRSRKDSSTDKQGIRQEIKPNCWDMMQTAAHQQKQLAHGVTYQGGQQLLNSSNTNLETPSQRQVFSSVKSYKFSAGTISFTALVCLEKTILITLLSLLKGL